MSWQNLFYNTILQRGRDYFYRGFVVNLQYDADSCSAIVVGSHRYHVRIRKDVFGDYHMNCDCQFASQGNNCKHMAATLFQWEKEKEKASKHYVNPFKREDFENCYFDLYRAAEPMRIEQRILAEAQRIREEHGMTIGKIETDYPFNSDTLCLSVEADQEETYYGGRTFLNFRPQELENGHCSVCGNYIDRYHGYVCEHMLALMLETGDYVRRYDPGDETSQNGQALLDRFARQRLLTLNSEDDNGKTAKVIQLEPRITDRGEELSLSFRIGIDKLYVVKNLSSLVSLYWKKETMSLGVDHDLYFRRQDFSDPSLPYYRFIEERVSEADAWTKHFRHTYDLDLSLKNTIELSGKALDDFYDLTCGKSVDYNCTDKRIHRLKIGEQDLKLSLSVSPYRTEQGEVKGIVLDYDTPRMFYGAHHHYYLKDGVLARLSEKSEQTLAPLLNTADKNRHSTVIGEKHLTEFYYRILPQLKNDPQITVTENEAETIASMLTPEAEFSFYLDREDEQVLCRGTIRYDETELPLKELRDEDFPLERYRDVPAETTVLNCVKKYFPFYDEEGGCFVEEKDDDKLYDLLNEGVEELMTYGDVHTSDAFERLKIRKPPVFSVGLSVDHDLLDLDILSSEMDSEELLSLLQSYRRRKKYHKLKNGEFVSFENAESLETIGQLLDTLNISLQDFVKGKMHLPVYRSLYINRLLEEHEEIAADRDRSFRGLIRNFNSVKDSEYEVPASLNGVLRGYQVYGYQWLHTLSDLNFGGILADDMGLGKTLQLITLLLARKEEYELILPALIVCPASLVYNWEEECRRFAPQLQTAVMAGSVGERKKILARKDYDVLITSYDLLKRDIDLYEDKVFSYEVLDEGQYIKNPKAVISKAVKIIKSAHRFVLTGTPIENRLSELWSIFDFLMPGFLYSYDRFRNEFENYIVRDHDEGQTERLRQMVSPFILRRSKKDVLKELPDKIEEVRYARFDKDQQQVYDGQLLRMKQMVNMLDENSGSAKIRILAELTKIRQICCDPSLLYENYHGESAKKEACMQLIESAIDGGHKILLFSQFTSMLEILEKELQERSLSYYKITGSTPKEERLRLVHQFNEDDTPLFLISLKAGGTGLNLTGADIVIHYDPWWNVAAQNQATDRAHRIGQEKIVSVFKLIAKDTIEEKILELQSSKKDLADSIISEEHTSITSLSREELLDLLG
ncbi:MAG: SNF2 helicase associated domain-containing protein [Erysipelotrichaceae bacterium]|nr:SNF2 helicase associated domain-containing protein [Erysipelotrichaceae bacterium]